MSYFDDASLVMIPSGYKDQKVYSVKPIDGSGDLTFSRGSDIEATRVAANGYIEKAKVNLLLQSNTFDTTWGNLNSIPTSGQSGYDGSSDAWKIELTANSGSMQQYITPSGVHTLSVYAKAGNVDWIRLRFVDAGNNNVWIDLSTGTASTPTGGISASATSVGGGWYRIEFAVNCSSVSEVRFYPAASDGNNGLTGDYIYIQDAQMNYGLVAQEYQETTTTSVVAGITNDLPRLDYSGGASCPSLLLEPSRINRLPNSEYMGAYSTEGVVTIEHNSAMSPEGVQNATNLIADATNSRHHLYDSSLAISQYATSVIYAKPNGHDYLAMSFINGSNSQGCGVIVDLTDGSVFSNFKNAEASFTINVSDAANGFKRVEFAVYTFAAGLNYFSWGGSTSTFGWNAFTKMPSFLGDNTSGILIYGVQVEMGVSFPSSYIPTYGTSLSRLADNAIIDPSSLVGATQGSWFFELDDLSFEVTGTSVPTNWIGYNVSNCLGIEGRAAGQPKNIYFVKEESNVVTTLATKEISTTLKACFVWNGTSLKCFVDGAKVYDAGGFTQPVAWSTFEFNSSGREAQQTLKQTLLFPTAISDADAIALTA